MRVELIVGSTGERLWKIGSLVDFLPQQQEFTDSDLEDLIAEGVLITKSKPEDK